MICSLHLVETVVLIFLLQHVEELPSKSDLTSLFQVFANELFRIGGMGKS